MTRSWWDLLARSIFEIWLWPTLFFIFDSISSRFNPVLNVDISASTNHWHWISPLLRPSSPCISWKYPHQITASQQPTRSDYLTIKLFILIHVLKSSCYPFTRPHNGLILPCISLMYNIAYMCSQFVNFVNETKLIVFPKVNFTPK